MSKKSFNLQGTILLQCILRNGEGQPRENTAGPVPLFYIWKDSEVEVGGRHVFSDTLYGCQKQDLVKVRLPGGVIGFVRAFEIHVPSPLELLARTGE